MAQEDPHSDAVPAHECCTTAADVGAVTGFEAGGLRLDLLQQERSNRQPATVSSGSKARVRGRRRFADAHLVAA
jgi:hypothetical protein